MLLLTRSTSFHCLITTRIPETQSASPLRLAARQCAAALDGDCAQSQESRKVQSSSRAAKGFGWYTDVRTVESQGKSVKEFQGCIRFSTPGPQRAAMRKVALHSPQSCRTQYASHTSSLSMHTSSQCNEQISKSHRAQDDLQPNKRDASATLGFLVELHCTGVPEKKHSSQQTCRAWCTRGLQRCGAGAQTLPRRRASAAAAASRPRPVGRLHLWLLVQPAVQQAVGGARLEAGGNHIVGCGG